MVERMQNVIKTDRRKVCQAGGDPCTSPKKGKRTSRNRIWLGAIQLLPLQPLWMQPVPRDTKGN